jgi:hypothetical protein
MKDPYQVVAYFSVELDSYKLFIKMSERNWEEELPRYYESLTREDKDSMPHRFNYRRDLASKLGDEFPQYQRKSYLIMLISIFEDFMNQLCQSIEANFDIKASFTDFAGSGIERAKQYLSKLSPLSRPFSGAEWEQIKKAQAIRNVIAHAAGHIENYTNSKLFKIIDCSENLDARDYTRTHLIIKSEYLFEVISAMNSFANKLMEECENFPKKSSDRLDFGDSA